MPHVYLDATHITVRHDHRIVSRSVVLATSVTGDGNREVLGVDVGDREDEVLRSASLRTLRYRGLYGVTFVISDAHARLEALIASGVRRGDLAALQGALGSRILATVVMSTRTWSPPPQA